jgi:hypothetical protein
MPAPQGTRVRFGKYAFVTKQSAKGAICPFCNVLHSKVDGRAVEGNCCGIYVRRRKAAFVVLAFKKGRAGMVNGECAVPTGRNFDRIASAAEKDWYENHA